MVGLDSIVVDVSNNSAVALQGGAKILILFVTYQMGENQPVH